MEIEIIGGGAGDYVGFAFGTSQRMEDADLYYCTEERVYSGAIRTFRNRPTTLPDTVNRFLLHSFF